MSTKDRLDKYKAGLKETSSDIGYMNAVHETQASRLEKLKLHFYKVTNQVHKYDAVLNRTNVQQNKLANSTSNLSAKIGGIITKGGLVAGTLLTAADMSGFPIVIG